MPKFYICIYSIYYIACIDYSGGGGAPRVVRLECTLRIIGRRYVPLQRGGGDIDSRVVYYFTMFYI
jgi:hypothetical protein